MKSWCQILLWIALNFHATKAAVIRPGEFGHEETNVTLSNDFVTKTPSHPQDLDVGGYGNDTSIKV